jgi:hypothetical protein
MLMKNDLHRSPAGPGHRRDDRQPVRGRAGEGVSTRARWTTRRWSGARGSAQGHLTRIRGGQAYDLPLDTPVETSINRLYLELEELRPAIGAATVCNSMMR